MATQSGKLLELTLDEQAVIVQFGNRLVAENRFAEAANVFELLRAIDPGQAFYHRTFGICCERTNRLDEGLAALDQALGLDPGDVFALTARAAIRMRTGDRAGAAQDLQAAQVAIGADQTLLSEQISVMLKAVA